MTSTCSLWLYLKLLILLLFTPGSFSTSVEIIDGNLTFVTDGGASRIGYKYGSNATVFFDEFSQTDQQIGLQLQMMYNLGKADSQNAVNLNYADLQATILNMTNTFITRNEVLSQIGVVSASIDSKINTAIGLQANITATNIAAMVATVSQQITAANIAQAMSTGASLAAINTSLVTIVNAEVVRAMLAETTLTNYVNNYVNTTLSYLNSSINIEIIARQSGDVVLASNISSLNSSLLGAINVNAAALATETLRAVGSENIITTKLSNINNTLISTVGFLTNVNISLVSTVGSLTIVNNSLVSAVASLTSADVTQANNLTTAIAFFSNASVSSSSLLAEISRATIAENNLATLINQINASIPKQPANPSIISIVDVGTNRPFNNGSVILNFSPGNNTFSYTYIFLYLYSLRAFSSSL